jgi:hypothetical protein
VGCQLGSKFRTMKEQHATRYPRNVAKATA